MVFQLKCHVTLPPPFLTSRWMDACIAAKKLEMCIIGEVYHSPRPVLAGKCFCNLTCESRDKTEKILKT